MSVLKMKKPGLSCLKNRLVYSSSRRDDMIQVYQSLHGLEDIPDNLLLKQN